MCACTATFVCGRCAGTWQDWRWHAEESPRELEEQQRDSQRYEQVPAKPWSEKQ